MDAIVGQNETSDRVDCRSTNVADTATTDPTAHELQLLLTSNLQLQRRILWLETRVGKHELEHRRARQWSPLSSVQVYPYMQNWIDENSWYDILGRDKYSRQAISTAALLLQEGREASNWDYWLELTRRMDLIIAQNDISQPQKGLDFQPDHQSDLIGAKLARVQALTRWTGEKHRLMNDVRRMLNVFSYEPIDADTRSYPMRRVGQSGLLRVPDNKRGRLMPYRGQFIRLVCVSNSNNHPGTVSLMVGQAAGQ